MIQPAKKILAEPPQNMDHWLLLASGPPISFDSALNLCLGDQMSPMEDSAQVRLEAAGSPVMLQGRSGGSSAALGTPRIVKEILNQRVSPDCVAQVVFDGQVTQRAVEKLIAYLQLAKDNYPDNGGPK